MKRPSAQRNRGLQVHRCGACGSTEHRINTCPTKQAHLIRSLQKQVKDLKGKNRKRRKAVDRVEKKTRSSPKETRKTHVVKQRKAYRGKVGLARTPCPAEVRRKKPQVDMFTEALSSESSAQTWLLSNGFLKRPRTCSECRGTAFYDYLDSEDRVAHWRCKRFGCGKRFHIFSQSVFHGLRCTSLVLLQMLSFYVRSSLTSTLSPTDLIQHCGAGQTMARHFLQCLRHVEAAAGERFFQETNLKGNIEAGRKKKGPMSCFYMLFWN